MAEYWGLKRIANRMGYRSEQAAMRLIVDKGFPAYQRPHRPNPNLFYYTNDDLIRQWELEQCKQTRDRIKRRSASKEMVNT